eukprot:GHVH01003334.1.p1 GENE.GHVH01003334.1~~GHVH01003334.1.p1  ORF type:complete len:643 (+),score=99.66 GHVH01003334.1:378-2306(+)
MNSFLCGLALASTAAFSFVLPGSEDEYDGVDFFLVQDVSYSYENDLPYLHDQVPKIVTYLATEYSDSRFGMATFVDKPMGNFGYEISGDYCYDMTVPLTGIDVVEKMEGDDLIRVGTLTDGKDLDGMLDNLETYSGRDWPENQLGALLHAIRSVQTGWDSSKNRVPFIALSTDSGYHVKGDAPTLKSTDGAYAGDVSTWCLEEDYPSVEQIKDAIEETGIKLLLLVTPDLKEYYESFLNEIGVENGIVVSLRQRSNFVAEAVHTGLEFYRQKGHSFGSTASVKLLQLLAAEQARMDNEDDVNKKDASPPSPFGDHVMKSFGSRTGRMFSNKNDLTQINSLKYAIQPQGVHEEQGVENSENPAAQLNCGGEDVVFEIVLVQDASDSFDNDKNLIAEAVPRVFRDIQSRFAGSRFGLSAFVDKPLPPLGWSEAGDYCASMRVGLTEDVGKVEDSLGDLIIRSGNDSKEAQLHGLMHTAYTHMADWSDNLEVDGKRIIRVAALTTDATYHEAGDSDLPENNGDRFQDCENEDYPSVFQVGDALKGQMIFPLFLVTDNVELDYENLLGRMGVNGAVRVMGDSSSHVSSLEDSIYGGLQSICNYLSVTPTDEMLRDQAIDMKSSVDSDVIELAVSQRPKFLSIVTKK